MIRCSRCKEHLPAERFAPSQRKNGSWCRSCYNVYRRANKDKRAAEARDWHRRHPGYARASTIKVRYGITVEEYEALKAGGCAVCGTFDRRLVIDHCHDTGRIRGCLCNNCNVAIGNADESADRLRALADYLA